MRGGAQGAGQMHAQRYARPDMSTELGAWVGVLTNNKSKGLRAQRPAMVTLSKARWGQTYAPFGFAMEIVVELFCF